MCQAVRSGAPSSVFQLQVGTPTPSRPCENPSYLHFVSTSEPPVHLRNTLKTVDRGWEWAVWGLTFIFRAYSDRFRVQAPPRCDRRGVMFVIVWPRVCSSPPLRAADVSKSMFSPVSLPCYVRISNNTNLSMRWGSPAGTLAPLCPAASLSHHRSGSTTPDKPALPAANHLVRGL